METQHHNKLLIISGIFLAIIVIGIGLITIRGKRERQTQVVTPIDTRSELEILVEEGTSHGPITATEAEIKELKTGGTAKSSVSASEREKILQMVSQN